MTTITINPTQDRLLVRLKPLPETTGLIVRVQHDESARWAEVLAVGPEVRDVRAGQTVLVNALAGQQVGDDILLSEDTVLAVEE